MIHKGGSKDRAVFLHTLRTTEIGSSWRLVSGSTVEQHSRGNHCTETPIFTRPNRYLKRGPFSPFLRPGIVYLRNIDGCLCSIVPHRYSAYCVDFVSYGCLCASDRIGAGRTVAVGYVSSASRRRTRDGHATTLSESSRRVARHAKWRNQKSLRGITTAGPLRAVCNFCASYHSTAPFPISKTCRRG